MPGKCFPNNWSDIKPIKKRAAQFGWLFDLKCTIFACNIKNLKFFMKSLSVLPLILFAFLLSACSGSYTFEASSLDKLNTDLKTKFGEDAWYTSIVLKNNSSGKNIVTVDVTKDPNSLRQAQWVLRGEWEKSSDISLRIDNGKPEDYMFQLDKEVSFKMIGKLIQQSIDQLKNEENIVDATVQTASAITKNEISNKQSGVLYTISLHSAAKDKSYSFVYNLDGSLKDFNK